MQDVAALLRDILPTTISVLAVTLSAFSVLNARRHRRHDIHFETVSQLYARLHDIQLLKLQHPCLSHLFTTADTYPAVKDEVETILRSVGPRERDEFRMRERATVSILLTFHEQVVFQWEHAGHGERAFIKEVIDYLELRLFRNPRILWWWSAEKVALAASYEALTRDRWATYVFADIDRSRDDWRDAVGPLVKDAEASCDPIAGQGAERDRPGPVRT